MESYRNKYIAALLAFFFGAIGVHRFYLRERGNGIAYIALLFVFISPILALIDFFAFMFMDQDQFDRKYNGAEEVADFQRTSYENYRDRRGTMSSRHARPSRIKRRSVSDEELNQLLRAGKKHYDEFDYFKAIATWEQITTKYPGHAAAHYNLACAYALVENATEGFHHLEQAVTNGFDDFKKIQSQDALAYLRIQDSYEDFQRNGFQSPSKTLDLIAESDPSTLGSNFIEQLKELGDLRDMGILTEEEFLIQKKKLIN